MTVVCECDSLYFNSYKPKEFLDQDVVKFVSISHCSHLPLEMFQILISVRVLVESRAIVPSEWLYQWKIPLTPAGIEPATLRFVAQYINHCATADPYILCTIYILHLEPFFLSSKFMWIFCTRCSKSNCMKILLRSQWDTALFTAGHQQSDRMYSRSWNCHPPCLMYTES